MKPDFKRWLLIFFILLLPLTTMAGDTKKFRIAVVSSYHPEYTWSQQTNEGVTSALLEFGYLDTKEQSDTFTKNYEVESSKASIKKWWMNTKQKNSQLEISKTMSHITTELDQFAPDIILLGDDNAAKYIGNYYLDSDIPVVFWGVNGIPLKYGLLDSIKTPGHNVTGIYQAGYHLDSVKFLKKLIPSIKTIAVLSDDSPTGRSHAKKIKRYGDQGLLDADIIEVVFTNSFSEWKREALALEKKVDAFYISTYHTLKDDAGNHVNNLDVALWYLENIRKPEIVPSSFIVKAGMLATLDDSAFEQGYQATKVAHSILSGKARPENIASYAPDRGPFIINRWRARMLGIEALIDKNADIIDQVIDESEAWARKENME